MRKEYTIKELCDMYQINPRTLQRHLSNLYTTNKNKVLVPLDVVELLKSRHNYDNNNDTSTTQLNQGNTTDFLDQEYDIIEGFYNEEYKEFQKRLIEYPLLQKDLEYHKKSAESHQRQMEKILNIMQERNLLEASNNPKFIK
jgi:hypothetical protein